MNCKYVIEATKFHNGVPSVITTFPEVYDTFDSAQAEVKPITLRQGDREQYMIYDCIYDAYNIRETNDY